MGAVAQALAIDRQIDNYKLAIVVFVVHSGARKSSRPNH